MNVNGIKAVPTFRYDYANGNSTETNFYKSESSKLIIYEVSFQLMHKKVLDQSLLNKKQSDDIPNIYKSATDRNQH